MNETADFQSLQDENLRLRGLVESFTLLNSSLELDEVLLNTLHTAQRLMKAKIGSIALINPERTHLVFVESTDPNFDRLKNFSVPLGKGIAGHVAESGKTVRVADVSKDERFYEKIDQAMQQRTESYICAPLIVDGTLIGTAQLMNRLDGQSFSESDETLMEGFARQAALAIHNAQMHSLKLRQKAIESEMGLCADIQKQLFPKETPALPGYELYGFSTPAREVGGDYYGYVSHSDNTTDIVVADISGKGIAASLMVSEFHTGYQLLSQRESNLLDAVNLLNAHLVDSLVVGAFITCFAGRVNPATGQIEYVLAGHNPPFWIHADGSSVELERTGMFLGLERLPFRSLEIKLEPGDLLAVFSDGYPETKNMEEDLYGEERMLKLLTAHRNDPLSEIHTLLEAEMDIFRAGAPYPDDRTLVLLRRVS
ncbi:MAG: SpoIIE family protein phosphatase [Leptospiraceae bacterium]|nr:SpoIIE family protein phosphatase [Leptospiraceae bacterium]MCP5485941.1 SpoIIE family protein phosphatase [Spirochaetales bacterium]